LKFIRSYIQLIDRVNSKIGYYVSWLTFLLVLIVSFDVFTRYFLKESSVAVQELEWHLFALIFLMGAAYTLKIDEHVRVDVFYSRLSEKKKAWINFIGTLLFLIPFCVVIIYASLDYVTNSFSILESSPTPGGLPARYLLKAVIPISFFFILLQGFSLLFKSLLVILNTSMEIE